MDDHSTTMNNSFSARYLQGSSAALQQAAYQLGPLIDQAAELLIQALAAGNKILVCGNGGSAADAQHFAAELVVRFEVDRRAYPAIALTTDTSLLTAAGNDLGFEALFSRQVEALGFPGDVLVAISTSGRSQNVVNAAQTARQQGLQVVVLTGPLPNPLAQQAHLAIGVSADQTAHIQVVHITAIHAICKRIESSLAA